MDSAILVAIDIAKASNNVLIQRSDSSKRKFKVASKLDDYRKFVSYLKALKPIFDSHRP
jgi:hypothetical protein